MCALGKLKNKSFCVFGKVGSLLFYFFFFKKHHIYPPSIQRSAVLFADDPREMVYENITRLLKEEIIRAL